MSVDLTQTSNRDYRVGRPYLVRAIWLVVEALVLLNPVVTPYSVKRLVLRLFGARIGRHVIIKPAVHVKYPWHLEIGDNSWIGERVWIDNFVSVRIGTNAVVSQGAYLCTGNHDWPDRGMPLMVKPVTVGNGSWVGAFSRIAPGVNVGDEAVIALGAVLLVDADVRGIYRGNPAVKTGERRFSSASEGL